MLPKLEERPEVAVKPQSLEEGLFGAPVQVGELAPAAPATKRLSLTDTKAKAEPAARPEPH